MTLLPPSLSLDFTTAVLDPRITFARAGATATRINSSGHIESVAADTARFDFNPVSLACRGLLVEGQRQNLVKYSSDFATAVASMWVRSSVTTTTGQLGPDNTNSATKFVQNNNTSSVVVTDSLNFQTFTSGATVTFSIYAKYDNSRWLFLQLGPSSGASTSRLRGWFDLQNGVAGSAGVAGAATGATVRMEPAANGFYRCILTGALNDGITSGRPLFLMADADGSTNRAATGAAYIVYGSQWENADSATSYIPNVDATQNTRNADVATITGTNFSDWWQASKGGVLVRARPGTVSGTRPWVQFDDNTADNIIALRGNTTNPELYIKATTDQAQIDAGTIAADTSYRFAGAWDTNNCAASLDSGAVGTDTAATIPVVTQARLGSDGTNYLNGHLESIEYWAQRLTNATLQSYATSAGYQSIIGPVVQDNIIS